MQWDILPVECFSSQASQVLGAINYLSFTTKKPHLPIVGGRLTKAQKRDKSGAWGFPLPLLRS